MVLLASTILNAAYFLPITYKAFFEKEAITSHFHAMTIRRIIIMKKLEKTPWWSYRLS